MITLQTRGRRLRAYSDEKLVTGSFGITAKLIMDSEWDGVEPTVTFKVGRSEFVAELNADGTYDVPFDLFSSESRYRTLLASVYGKKNGEVVISTTYTPIGEIIDGSSQTTNSGNIQKLFTLYNGLRDDIENITAFTDIDETLIVKDGVLCVNTADSVEKDNTLPVTSAAVHTEIGNIEILLAAL